MKIVDALKSAWGHTVDAILPPRPRAARASAMTLDDIAPCPSEHELLGARVTTLFDYKRPAVQDLVRALKYDRSAHAARLAAEALAEYLREEIGAARAFGARRVLLVPIPLHPRRARERGFNQIELVLRALPEEFRNGELAAFAPRVLMRAKATKPQTRLPRSERLENVRGAFAADPSVRKARVYLIDDVTTTGATLLHGGRALQKAGAHVVLLALARA